MPVIVPAPVAVSVTEVLDVMVFVIAMAAESVRLKPPLPAVDTPLPVRATESVNVTAPVVFTVTFGVAIVNGPIVPDALDRVRDVGAVMVPVPVMLPEPAATIERVPAELIEPLFVTDEADRDPLPEKLRVPLTVAVLVNVSDVELTFAVTPVGRLKSVKLPLGMLPEPVLPAIVKLPPEALTPLPFVVRTMN